MSLDIGCVRLTERFLRSDPPTADEVSAAASAIGRELDRAAREIPVLADAGGSARLVGLAGTVSTLASLELGLSHYDRDRIHHAVLSRQAVGRWCEVLGAERIADRARRPGLPAGRQDVIFGGALVLHEVMCRFDLPECIVSEADILDGLVMSLLDSPGSGSPRARVEWCDPRDRAILGRDPATPVRDVAREACGMDFVYDLTVDPDAENNTHAFALGDDRAQQDSSRGRMCHGLLHQGAGQHGVQGRRDGARSGGRQGGGGVG